APGTLDSSNRYWIKTGESVALNWNSYSLDILCSDPSKSFPFNLCNIVGQQCWANGECIYTRHGNLQLPAAVGMCSDWPDNREVIFLGSRGGITTSASDGDPSVHLVGPDSNLNVWLVQRPCMNGMCLSNATPTATASFLWSDGCSPATVSFSPV